MTDTLIHCEEEFDDLLGYAVHSEGRVVVLFTAPSWCQPCRRFEPHWRKASEQSDLPFFKVDMGKTPEDTGVHWASSRFNILGVPSVKVFRTDGPPIDIQARAVVPFLKEIHD